MSLAPGSRVGPYEILALLGVGGMGEVYRARDHKLGRDVAIKVLAAPFTADPDRLARFEREARMLAALNHPNIATIHGLEESGDVRAFVMELVEGETLSARLASSARGGSRPLRTAGALEIARQIAAALDAAHAQGIVHRDLKPDNVMIAPNGTVKVLDFGVGKIWEPDAADPSGATAAATETKLGAVLGTPAYMSPEQARGFPVDKRTDVWAFGCVLYQLLTGRPPFEGATVADTLSAVLEREPDWGRLPATLPPAIRRLLQRCLQKDPHQRLRDIGDIWIQLEDALAESEPAPAAQALPPRRRVAVAAATALALLAVGGFVAARYLGLGPTGPATGLQYTPLTSFADAAVQPSLSPDGRMLTYIRGDSTFMARGQVYVQLLPGGDPVQLTNDDWQKMSPVFSPDGSQIAYTVDNWDTMIVPVLGGQSRTLLVNASGLTWLPGHTSPPRVLYSEMTGESIHMVISTATEGGLDSRRVYAPPTVNGMAHRSAASPDGRWVLVVEMLGGWLPCRVVPFDGNGPAREVGPPGAPCTDAAWSPDGRWIYVSGNTGDGFHIWRQRFPDGEPEQVTFGATEEQGIAFFPDGKSFVTSVGTDINTVWLHDARGDRQITSQGYAYQPKLSPDRTKLYYLLRAGASTRTWVKGELWVTDLTTGDRRRLFPDFQLSDYAISPDGTTVVLGVAETGALWIGAADGRTPPRPLGDASTASGRAVFGPRGDVYFAKGDPDGAYLYRVDADGTGLRKALEAPADVFFVYDISPDGKWAALWAGAGVVIAPLDGGEPVMFCSGCGTMGAEHRGVTPVVTSWSRDGRYLYVHAAWTSRATYAIPLEPGQMLPPLPEGGVRNGDDLADLPGVFRLPELRAFPSDDPSTYVFMRATSSRNIYRIPVP